MSLREWLVVIGALLIVGIIVDGLRRMHRTRKEAAAISEGMGANDIADPDDDSSHNPELPNGGSRPIDRDALESRGYLRTAPGPRFSNPPQKPTRPVVADSGTRQTDPASADGSRDTEAEPDHPESISTDPGLKARDTVDFAPDNVSMTAYDDEPLSEDWHRQTDSSPNSDHEAFPADEPTLATTDAPEADSELPNSETVATKDEAGHHQSVGSERDAATDFQDVGQPKAGANRPDAQEVIVINVLADEDRSFDGRSLRKLFEGCGLEFGDMAIYHRHEENDTRSPVQFSVANAVEPGTFRDKDLNGVKTPGISFFMSLPGPSDFMQAFEFMLETAQCVVNNLGGELKDEGHSVMTRQTIEHCRQKIREYERKRRSQRAG